MMAIRRDILEGTKWFARQEILLDGPTCVYGSRTMSEDRATCQQGKILTTPNSSPNVQNPYPPAKLYHSKPSQLDLIIGLPPNARLGFNPHHCGSRLYSRCPVPPMFLPTVTGPKVAQLYLDNVYKCFGPTKQNDLGTETLVLRLTSREH